jgi:hypothetical protein
LSLTNRAGFERFVSELPGTSLVEQWESVVAKVGGKVFCLFGPHDGSITSVSETCPRA